MTLTLTMTLTLLLISLPFVITGSRTLFAWKIQVLRDERLSDFITFNLKGIKNVIECANECLGKIHCVTFQYDVATLTCRGHGITYVPQYQLRDQEMAILYITSRGRDTFGGECPSRQPCKDPFTCVDGRCACAIGYSFNAARGTCITYCQQYGGAFTGFRNKGISHYNTERTYTVSVDQCLGFCRQKKTFVCRHAEVDMSRHSCILSNSTWYGVPRQSRTMNDPGWTIYFRQCGETV